ncbi:MAG: DUF3800 domain-containing protein [Alphaproteobacteria bacterium]
MADSLVLTPNTLLVFIDETGNEDYSDPNNPTFGRGGCAVLGEQYKTLIRKPWRKLKRERLGGATRPFHATEFEQTRPTKAQITGINQFLKRPFWRFAIMSDGRTALPKDVDGHRAVSLFTVRFISRLVANYAADVARVALVFEASGKGDDLVRRDFDLANMQVTNRSGRLIEVGGYFMEKKWMETGLEVADLVAHTAGRQRRYQLRGKTGPLPDFEAMYWHSPIPPAFMSIDTVVLNELSIEDKGDI